MTLEPLARAAAASPVATCPAFAPLLDRARRMGEAGTFPAANDVEALARPPCPALASWSPSAPEDGPAGVVASPLVARIALLERPEAASQSIELSVTRDLGVKLSRTDAGLAVVVEAAPDPARPAEVELPRIVDALRARGIAVAHASVRAVRSRPRPR